MQRSSWVYPQLWVMSAMSTLCEFFATYLSLSIGVVCSCVMSVCGVFCLRIHCELVVPLRFIVVMAAPMKLEHNDDVTNDIN